MPPIPTSSRSSTPPPIPAASPSCAPAPLPSSPPPAAPDLEPPRFELPQLEPAPAIVGSPLPPLGARPPPLDGTRRLLATAWSRRAPVARRLLERPHVYLTATATGAFLIVVLALALVSGSTQAAVPLPTKLASTVRKDAPEAPVDRPTPAAATADAETAQPDREAIERAERLVRQGRRLQSRRRWLRARALYEEARALDPDNVAAGASLSRVLIRLGDTDQAVDLARSVSEADPDSLGYRILLGDALAAAGDRAAARRTWRAALELAPRSRALRRRLRRR